MLMGCNESDLGVMDTKFVPSQTSVPEWVLTYCRQLADVNYGHRLSRMYIHMLESFLAVAPWEANPPFEWRLTRIHRASGTGARASADPGWVPMNMTLPIELVDKIKVQIEKINTTHSATLKRELSLRTFLFTAVCWWCLVVYPYKGPGLINSI